jgi:hypothetical protein
MTQNEFWSLYDNGHLENVKHWTRKDADNIIHNSEITSFTYDGKYYLRISEFKGYYGWWVGRGSSRHFKVDHNAPRRYTVLKEFDNKNAANAYFKKCAIGYIPYDITAC